MRFSQLACCILFAASLCPADDPSNLFAARVRPLLEQKCGACHGDAAQEIEGGFDIRSRAAMVHGGESEELGIDLVHPERSTLLRAVRWQDGLEMPPKENDRLTDEQVRWIEEWITGGAPWAERSASADPWEVAAGDGGVRVRTSGGQSDSWTYRTYEEEDLWSYRPIAKPDVPWGALLDGATRHPIDAFIQRRLGEANIAPASRADDATLLRRVAYSLTGLPPERSASSNEPFSQVVEDLLASPHYGERMAQHWLDVVRYADSNGFARDDMRPDAHKYRTYVIEAFNADKPFDRFVREQIAGDELGIAGQEALSYLWMGPWEHTAMSVAAVTRQQWLDDVTNSIGVTFLGQQLRCAKCHDHKFDPIPTRDYYEFQAIFAGTKHHQTAGSFKVRATKVEPVSILQGGALESPTEEVAPGALSVLTETAGHEFPAESDQPRAALARWISSEKNPLTARVIVNRVWQMHFGRGLVATPNDYGKNGADPTHPELLDWLAGWLIENGWSLKSLHRLILTSETYRRRSQHPNPHAVAEADPDNHLLSYFPSRRLTAEEIRDSMLAITGELNRSVGGPSVYPEINWEVAFQPRLLMGKIAPPYEPSPKRAERNRRSIYAVRIRNLGHPFMEVMNRPGSELSCAVRDETTVTPQAFTMLHGEFVHERALALAANVASEHQPIRERVSALFEAIYHREPSERELTVSMRHVDEMHLLHSGHEVDVIELPKSIELQEVAERTGEAKTKTFLLKKLANYEDDLKPWQVQADVRALADLCLVLLNSSEFLYVY